LDSLERGDAEKLILSFGGEVVKSVTKKLTHALVGNEPGPSKMAQITERGIPVLDEDALFELIRSSPEGKPDKKFLEKRAKAEKVAVEGKVQSKEAVKEIAVAAKQQVGQAPEMWTTKYAPKSSQNLISNAGAINKVKAWLKRWQDPAKCLSDKNFKRAVLISGVPGIGKSTTAALLAKEAGYEVIEFNASDARSKKRLQAAGFMEISGNRSLNEFFKAKDQAVVHRKKTLVIMDEVDGMGAGDRGGNQELIALIKKTQLPVICICNDRQKATVKSLANYCEDVRFNRPGAADIASRLRVILQHEGFVHVDQAALQQLCASVNNDIRQVLNLLQMLRVTSNRLDASVEGSFENSMAAGRHVEQNVFSVMPQVFSGQKTPSKGLDLFFHDYELMPLFVQENYLRATPAYSNPIQAMHRFADAADQISYGDLVKDSVMKAQNWSLLPFLGMISTVVPGEVVRGRSGRVDFPAFLGKLSNGNKQKRLLKDISIHMSSETSGTDKNEIRLDYIPALLDPLSRPLIEEGQEGIPKVISLMDQYHLNKDDWESLFLLVGKEELITGLDSKLKAAFTRKYNKTHQKVLVSSKTGRGATIADDEVEGVEDEDDGSENVEDTTISKKDPLIKQPKPKKAAPKKAAPKKAATSKNKK
jgi:replication factor C subunit 1